MNRVHRIVWNAYLGCWVVAPEIARSRGKGGLRGTSRKALIAALVTTGGFSPTALSSEPPTTVIPVGGNTNAYISANGVPVVNIDTANAAGLSHNTFTRYDIEANGLVLNNANSSQISNASELAGQIYANPNLTNEASIILNEVVSTNRSTLAGFTEVVGGRADVIVANPNGISCSGCGFINTDRATLTTGSANLNDDGSLNGFTVNGGDVFIGGSGLNASAQQTFDIVTQSVKLEGAIHTAENGRLDITAGLNTWSYAGRNVTSTLEANGEAPEFAIDSSVLGGMYAGRIRLIATESGVGVRMFGDAAASAEEFTLSSEGDIEIRSAISARQDIDIVANSGSNINIFEGETENSGSIRAGLREEGEEQGLDNLGNLTLSATGGLVSLENGRLYAKNNLSLTANTLIDNSDSNSTRYAGYENSLNITDSATITGSTWAAGEGDDEDGSNAHGQLNGDFRTLTLNGTSTLFYSGANVALTTGQDLSLGDARIHSVNDLSLTSEGGSIAITSNGQLRAVEGELSIDAADELDNSGKVQGANATVVAASLTNSGTLHSASDLEIGVTTSFDNTGKLLAVDDITIAGNNASEFSNGTNAIDPDSVINAGGVLSITGNSAGFNTSGNILADTMALSLASLTNYGTIQSKNGADITTTGALTNTGTLTVSYGDDSSQELITSTLNVASLDNRSGAALQAFGDLNVTLTGDSLKNAGTILASDDLVFRTENTLDFNNSGIVKAGGLFDLDYDYVGGRLPTTQVTVDNTGKLFANEMFLNIVSLDNKHLIQINHAEDANQVSQINISGSLNNSGTITFTSTPFMGENNQPKSRIAEIIAAGIDNHGTIQAAGNQLTVQSISDDITNHQNAVLHSANQLIVHSANNVINRGEIAGGSTTISGSSLQNKANANIILALNSGGSGGVIVDSVVNNGTISSAGNASFSSLNSFTNNSGDDDGSTDLGIMVVAGDLHLTGSTFDLTNSGWMQSNGEFRVRGADAISIEGDATLLAGSMDVRANELEILSSGWVQSNGGLVADLSADLAIEEGATLWAGSMDITANTISNTGWVESSGNFTADLSTDLNITQNSTLMAHSMNITANALSIESGVSLETNGDMVFNLNSLSLSGETLSGETSKILGGLDGGEASVDITLANDLENFGVLFSGGNLSLDTPEFTNTGTGGISALNNLTLEGQTIRNEGGFIYAGNTLNMDISLAFINESGGVVNGHDLIFSSETFRNTSDITATGDITIDTTVSLHNFNDNIPSVELSGPTFNAYTPVTHNDGDNRNPEQITTHRQDVVTTESLSETAGSRPQIIAGGDLAIDINAGVLENYAGIISANGDMSITGSEGSSASNTPFMLNTYTSTQAKALYAVHYPVAASDYHWYTASTKEQAQTTLRFSSDNVINWGAAGAWTYVATQQWGPLHAMPEATTSSVGIGSTIKAGGALTFGGSLTVINGTPGVANADQAGITVTGPNEAGGSPLGSRDGSTINTDDRQVDAADTGVNGSDAISGTISFDGVKIDLPQNPSGYFVPNQDPNSHYLIETNPLFSVDSPYAGSDFFIEQYGYNPDDITRRLGDANYEAYLIRQQLIAQAGNNLLNGYANEADQMSRMMEQAVTEGEEGGFVFGEPLTPEQIASLDQDIVWMVETTVSGQRVLAPVVYLSAATRDAALHGAVIAGDSVEMDVESVANNGGTISGSRSLSIRSTNDVVNTSGTITGGDVSIESTEGSIINKTTVSGFGGDSHYETTIGREASITATGDLSLDAAKDITVLGAEVIAGGNGSLSAGGDITFDTIVDRETTSSTSTSSGILKSGSGSSTVTTETNIGSTLQTGGNLSIDSGGDTTIAGSEANVGGDLDVETGGDFGVVARQDSVTTHSETSTTGIGVGGGIYGKETTTTDSFSGTNVGSTLTVGGDAAIHAEDMITVQGSDVAIGGNADIEGTNGINILDGLDEERSTTTTETTTYLNIGKEGTSSSDSDSDSESQSSGTNASANASAEANATAEADASGSADIKLVEITTSTTESGSNTSVASTFSVGGGLSATSDGTMTIQGSDVSAGGDIDIDVENLEMLTGRNEEWSTTETVSNSVGIYNDGEANAEANANADAQASLADTDASASADASAGAGGVTTVGVRTTTTETTDYSLTNSSSSLVSGGNMNIQVEDTATFVGAEVESGGDMLIEAENINNLAAQDIDTHTTSTTTHTAGLYIAGEATAEAKANANADVGGLESVSNTPAGASASTEVTAEVSAGIRHNSEHESSTSGSITQQTTSFTSGGDFTRNAEGTIVDQGTQIEAAGNIDQSANEIREIAASDSTYSSSESSSHDTRVGVGASGNAESGADATSGTTSDSGGGIGARGSYEGDISSESNSSSTAVTTSYKSGGNINSSSEETTSLIGTQFESAGDVNIDAGSLEYQAARDTNTTSSTSHDIDAEGQVDVYGDTGGSASGSYANEGSESQSTTAQVGGINAAGDVTITSRGDANFEGTNITAGENAAIDADGDVNFSAARDTEQTQTTGIEANAEFSSSDGGRSATVGGGYSESESASSTAHAGGITAGNEISVTAGNDANFEGTNFDSGGDTAIAAAGDVNLSAAQNTETSSGFNVEGSVGASKEESEGTTTNTTTGSLGGGVSDTNSVQSEAGTMTSGGGISISAGGDANLEGTQLSSEGSTTLSAGGDVNLMAAENTETNNSLSGSFSGSDTTTDDDASNTNTKSGTVAGSATYTDKVESSGVSIQSGGAVVIEGENVVNQEATIEGDGSVQITGNEVNIDAAESDVSFNMSVSGTKKSENKTNKPKTGSKTTDDIPDQKSSPEVDSTPRAKTTDDIPTRSASDETESPKTDSEKAAERQAIFDQLRADKTELDKTVPKTTSSTTTTTETKTNTVTGNGA